MRYSLFTAALVLVLALPVGAQTINRIAAVVNDEIITTYQIEQELRTLAPADLPPGRGPVVRQEVLDRLIEEALLQQRIRELGIKVGDDELEAAIQDVQRQNNLTRPQLEEALRIQGMEFEEYKESLRTQVLRFKLLSREVQSKVEVSNEEVRDYFRENIDRYRENPSVRLSRISFPFPDRASREKIEAVRLRAEEAHARLLRGESFTNVLLSYSPGGEAEGGDMGRVEGSDLTPSFARAIRGLQEGEVSEPVETPHGIHLLQVTEVNPGRVRQFDSVKDEITVALKEKMTEERLKQWSKELRKNAHIDVRL